MMRTTGRYIRLEHYDPKTNRHRHYALSWEPTLWHPVGVAREAEGLPPTAPRSVPTGPGNGQNPRRWGGG